MEIPSELRLRLILSCLLCQNALGQRAHRCKHQNRRIFYLILLCFCADLALCYSPPGASKEVKGDRIHRRSDIAEGDKPTRSPLTCALGPSSRLLVNPLYVAIVKCWNDLCTT